MKSNDVATRSDFVRIPARMSLPKARYPSRFSGNDGWGTWKREKRHLNLLCQTNEHFCSVVFKVNRGSSCCENLIAVNQELATQDEEPHPQSESQRSPRN